MVIEPPRDIKIFTYNCGGKFKYEEIDELFKVPTQLFGVMQIYGEEFIISTCNEFSELKTIVKKSTKVQKKQGHGGQSQNRIARLRDESIHNYLKLAAEKANDAYKHNNVPTINGLLIIGAGFKKDAIIPYLNINVYIEVVTKDQESPLLPIITEFINKQLHSVEHDELQYIQHLFDVNPDILAFGVEELASDNIKKIYNNPLIVDKFGGPVGVRYY